MLRLACKPLKKRHFAMKTIPVSFLLSGMLLPSVCFGQPTEPKPGTAQGEKAGHGGPMRAFIEAWKLADADHDGSISKAEFNVMPRTLHLPEEKRENLFKRLDKNGDGKLSPEELGQMAKPHEGSGPKMQRLWELDTDHSGGISFEEFKVGQIFSKLPLERQQEIFHRLDTDGDGVITPKDRPEPPFKRPDGPGGHAHVMPNPPDASGQIDLKLDTNHDGVLSFEEFRAAPSVKNLPEDEQEKRFTLLDRNGDLKITPYELSAPPEKSKP